MATKKSSVLTHAKKAFFTRYEIRLTDELYRQILNDIRDNKTRIIMSQGSAVVHEININGTKVPIVYRNKQIITALPANCLDVKTFHQLYSTGDDKVKYSEF